MMREADFAALLHLVERLSLEQRTALGRALAAASGESEAIRLLEEAFLAAPRCPHCAATALQRWGYASGLRRYRCTACRKTFNALTGTSLARLRKKECWLAYGEALAAGLTLVRAAGHCRVHMTTSFRRRHRFLKAPEAAREALAGVVEADETFFRRSYKGSRRWHRAEEPLERRPHRRGERASKRGLSAEQVPALIARDRAGHTAGAVLPDLGAAAIAAALGPVIASDAVLCSDGAQAYAGFAARRGGGAVPGRARDSLAAVGPGLASSRVTELWVALGFSGDAPVEGATRVGVDRAVAGRRPKNGFELEPKRWLIEQNFGKLARYRR